MRIILETADGLRGDTWIPDAYPPMEIRRAILRSPVVAIKEQAQMDELPVRRYVLIDRGYGTDTMPIYRESL